MKKSSRIVFLCDFLLFGGSGPRHEVGPPPASPHCLMAYGQIERRFQVQPQAEGLLQTLHDSLAQQEKFAPLTGATPHAGETAETDADVRDRARKLMHRLVAATNRCLHKGFPSIYAYLLGKPTHYTSHQFVPLVFEYTFRAFWAALPMQQSWTGEASTNLGHT